MSRLNSTLTQARLHEVLHYDPRTGQFTWIANIYRKKLAGTIAGSIVTDGYWRIGLDKKAHKAHRLAWLYMYGEWPDVIDHIDGNRLNNRISNLRNASRSINCQNLKRANTNNKSSGLLGVTRYKCGVYGATIRVNSKNKYLGSFANPTDAHAAYLVAKRKFHPGCTI